MGANQTALGLRQRGAVKADQDGQTQQGDVEGLVHANLTRLQCHRSLKWNSAPDRNPAGQREVTVFSLV